MSSHDQAGRMLIGPRRADRLLTAYLALSALCAILILVNAPIAVDAAAGHDDGLFMRIGRLLAHGQWLGPFDHYTLMKGPGYPAFLALVSWFGLPVSLAHALLHCAAMLLVALVCRRFVGSRLAVAGLFTLLLWHPVFFTDPMLRVVRDLLASLQLVVLVVVLGFGLLGAATARGRALCAAASGLLLGWLWLTREETVWILPAIAIVLLAAGHRALHAGALRGFAASVAIALATFAATQAAFEAVNWRVYGKLVGVDVKEASFQRAVGALQGIRAGPHRPFVAMTGAAMQQAYAASPGFATLRPHLDGPIGNSWRQTSCDTLSSTCGDIGAGWFIWALRDAAGAAGVYSTPERASSFFGQVADEIDAACVRRQIACAVRLVTVLPDYPWHQLALLPGRLVDFLRLLLFVDRPPLNPADSTGDPALLGEMMQFLHHPLRTPTNYEPLPRWTLHGWYLRGGDQWFSLSLRDRTGTRALALERHASPDLVAVFNDPAATRQRFDVAFQCATDCVLRVSDAQGGAIEMPLSELPYAPFRWRMKDAQFHVDRLHRSFFPPTRSPLQAPSERVRSVLLSYYPTAFLPVLALGALAFLAVSVRHWRSAILHVGYVIALAAWVLVVTRVSLLAFLDATSFQVWSFKYMGPAYPLLACAAVLSLATWRQLPAIIRQAEVLRASHARRATLAALQSAWGRVAERLSAVVEDAPAVAVLRRHARAAILPACLAAGAAAAVWQGQDGNWDLLNYHLYNVFWLLEGRRHVDFVANGLHNFLSPLADIPFYYLSMKWLPAFPRTVTAIQGLYFGALIYVVFRINARVLCAERAIVVAAIATAIGVTGAATLPEAGTTYNDIQVALLVLSGVLILLPLCEQGAAPRLVLRSVSAGALCGAAAGVKLTAILFAPGVACAILLAIPLRRAIAIATLFGIGWWIGFALSYGWWGWLLWEMTGNPLFPFYNGIFRSDWAPPQNFGPHYGLTSWTSLLTYPFYWLRLQRELVTELPFRDARFAAAFLSILFLALVWLARLRALPAGHGAANPLHTRAGRFIVVYFLVTYAIWLPVSIALRYAVAIEVLTGTLMLLAASAFAALLPAARLRTAAAPLLGLLALAVFLVHTSYPPWARREYGERVFSIRVPDMPPNSMVILHHAPFGYLLPFIRSPGWSAVSVSFHFSQPGYKVYETTKQRIAAHDGSIFVLYAHLEPPSLKHVIEDMGVIWHRDRCRPVESNMSWGLSLCDAQKK